MAALPRRSRLLGLELLQVRIHPIFLGHHIDHSTAASAFFKKTSEKPKSLMKWSVHETLIKGRYRISDVKARDKVTIAAFDLDGTLIKTQSGSAYARSETDWKFYSSRVVSTIRGLHDQGVQLVIFSNQVCIQLHPLTAGWNQDCSGREAVRSVQDEA